MKAQEYMRAALKYAEDALKNGEVPVGCVIVKDGNIIAHGENQREKSKNALAHAEIQAIDMACKEVGDWRLSDCDLYVTLEPCPMCAGAIINARIRAVYYGASDTVFGACGGVMNLFEEAFSPSPKLYGGILSEECGTLISDFFAEIRK